eukprot:UC4_evm3s94
MDATWFGFGRSNTTERIGQDISNKTAIALLDEAIANLQKKLHYIDTKSTQLVKLATEYGISHEDKKAIAQLKRKRVLENLRSEFLSEIQTLTELRNTCIRLPQEELELVDSQIDRKIKSIIRPHDNADDLLFEDHNKDNWRGDLDDLTEPDISVSSSMSFDRIASASQMKDMKGLENFLEG